MTPSQTLNPSERAKIEATYRAFPFSWLPNSWKPYAELIRIDRPAGILMCYLPCLYGTFLVGNLEQSVSLVSMLVVNLKFLLLSAFLRSTLVTWNDILDQDIDRQVERTRTRPLPRRAISTQNALGFLFMQVVMVFGVYRLLPKDCLYYSTPFLLLHVLYPLAKRLTHHPQLVLGFALCLGVVAAFPALDHELDFGHLGRSVDTASALCLCAAIIFWTLLNDTIYAAQDVEGDSKAGVGSTAVYWGSSLRNFLRILGLLQLVSLCALSFILKDTSPMGGLLYDTLTCGGTFIGIMAMVECVDLKNAASCGWWFHKGNLLVGCAIGSGLVAEYASAFIGV